jgi:hypothetical protein
MNKGPKCYYRCQGRTDYFLRSNSIEKEGEP